MIAGKTISKNWLHKQNKKKVFPRFLCEKWLYIICYPFVVSKLRNFIGNFNILFHGIKPLHYKILQEIYHYIIPLKPVTFNTGCAINKNLINNVIIFDLWPRYDSDIQRVSSINTVHIHVKISGMYF